MRRNGGSTFTSGLNAAQNIGRIEKWFERKLRAKLNFPQKILVETYLYLRQERSAVEFPFTKI